MIEVTLRVQGTDISDASVDAVIAEHFPDTSWDKVDGLTTLTVFVEREDAVTETVGIVRRVEAAIPGLKIIGVHRDLVGTTDVALRVGVSREGARKWSLSADFPTPFDYIGAGSMKVWVWAEVVQWLEEARALDMDQELPSLELMTHIENCIMRNPDHTTVQWHQTMPKFPNVQKPIFQVVQPAARVSAGGRAQEFAVNFRELVGAAAPRT
ncbi:helix-turn-helix transcriptional regulator [Paeniglutamicibacter sp. MACA_103]|uniref:helix-turn-helix transcriptional regulator n=1 Tax=Paeniglutamicibacter sp. MACA_103 TaxID=3377337 RepID=UPI003895651E